MHYNGGDLGFGNWELGMGNGELGIGGFGNWGTYNLIVNSLSCFRYWESWRIGEVVTLLNSEIPNLPIAKAITAILVILLFIPARCEGGWLSSIFRFHQLGESPYIKKGVHN